MVWLVALGRMYAGAHLPLDVVGGAALGWAVAAATHLAVGAPGGRPTASAIREGLRPAGIDPATVDPLGVDARGSVPSDPRPRRRALLRQGGRPGAARRRPALQAVALGRVPGGRGRDPVRHSQAGGRARGLHRAAGRPRRGPHPAGADRRPHRRRPRPAGPAARRRRDAGPPAPSAGRRPAAGRRLGRGGAAARRSHRPPGSAARQRARRPRQTTLAAGLRVRRGRGQPRRLAADVAELLASLASVVGADRTVRSATEALGVDAVVQALPLLQPAALAAATRADLKAQPRLLDELRERTAATAGTEPPRWSRSPACAHAPCCSWWPPGSPCTCCSPRSASSGRHWERSRRPAGRGWRPAWCSRPQATSRPPSPSSARSTRRSRSDGPAWSRWPARSPTGSRRPAWAGSA